MKQLHSKDGKATFTLPVKYKPSTADKDRITFSFHYPSMEPIRPGKAPEDDEITIYLSPTKASDRSSENYAKNLEHYAIDRFNPARLGLQYRIGQQGIYRMYQMGNPDEPKDLSTYYIFQAADGQLIYIKDPVPFIVLFTAHRTIAYRFDVQYTIAKKIGKDFVKIDEVVTAPWNPSAVRPSPMMMPVAPSLPRGKRNSIFWKRSTGNIILRCKI
ncbi:hypothetical protein HAV38_13465 [Glaciimonas immobilis]|nr:hypothetical protein HAV38_13465 [Glaciimonas immobilis]